MKKISLIWVISLLVIFGCTGKNDPIGHKRTSKVIAKVNGVAITEDDLSLRPRRDNNHIDNKSDSLETIIRDELFYQQGLKLGLDKSPEYLAQVDAYERQMADMKRSAMRRLVYNREVVPKINTSDQEAKDFYNRNVNQITTEYHLAMIWLSTREQAEITLGKLQKGMDFKAVAGSILFDKAKGGRAPWDMGYLSWDRIPVDFIDTISKMKPGEARAVLTVKATGYPLIKLMGVRKNTDADFEKMSVSIMHRLRENKINEAYKQYVAKLLKNAKIEKF